MPKNDPIQTKLFGPKKGLNKAESPLKRALPSGPNAGAPEFATEFKNFYIDPNDGVMKVRKGFSFVNKNLGASTIGELGIERFNNYNEKGEAEPVVLALGTSNSYVVKKARVKITAASGSHKLTLLFHPTSGDYEVVHTNAITGVEIDRLSLSNVDIATLDSLLTDLTIEFTTDLYTGETYDGTDTLSNVFPFVDLEIISTQENEIAFDSIQEIETCVDLSDAVIDNASSTIAVFAEINNKMFIAIDGLPILKYEGNCIAKAGLPDPDVVSKEAIILAAGVGLDDSERTVSPLWSLPVGDGTNFALTKAQAAGNEILKGRDAFNRPRAIDTDLQNSIYALAYEQRTLLSTAIGSSDEEGNVFVTKSNQTSGDYIDKTVSPSQNLAPFGPNEEISHQITVKNLQRNNGWDVIGADVGERAWIIGRASDQNIGTTNWTLDINQHNFREEDKGKKVYLNVRLVTRDNVSFSVTAFYKHQQFLIECELIDFTATTLELSKDITWYNQPGGLEGVKVRTSYDNLNNQRIPISEVILGPLADHEVGMMVYGGASLDTFVNIYESTSVDESLSQGFNNVDYAEASFNLVAQLPNNPFTDNQVFYNWYDRNDYGNLYDDLNRVGDTNADTGSLEDHSSLPIGRIITSHKGRLYITGDPNAINIVYGTSLVFGPEKYNVSGDDSFDVRDDIGDFITGLAPLGTSLAVLKSNSTHIVQGDFATGNIRRDIITSEGFGCVSHHSISQIKDGIAYLSQEGAVYWRYGAKPQMMGSVYMNREAGSEPMSRIRGFLSDRSLDLKRSISFNDFQKELYILYIPKTNEKHKGLTGTSKEGLTLVYDYMNDMWFEYTNYEFRSGGVYVNDTLYRAHSKGNGTSSLAEQKIEREWQTNTLFDFQDDFNAIDYRYDSDWDAFLEPSIFKKPMHIKVFGYNLFDTISLSSVVFDLDLTGDFRLLCSMYNDYRDDKLHTKNTLNIDSRKLADRIKATRQKVISAKVSITNANSEIFKCPCIMGIEVEYQAVHRGFQKPWSAS